RERRAGGRGGSSRTDAGGRDPGHGRAPRRAPALGWRPLMSIGAILAVMALGSVGGLLGALLGLGGGVFVVPFLSLFIGLSFREAAAIGLMTVIATSSVVSAQRSADGVINVRLGIVLEIATTLGG